MNGKSLIQYPVDAASKSKYVDTIYVSTDSRDISNVVLDMGLLSKLYVIRRSPENAKDHSNSEDALKEVCDLDPVGFDIMVFMQCTSPLTTAEDIDGALRKFTELEMTDAYRVYSVMSCCPDEGGWLCGGFSWGYDEYNKFSRINPYSHQRQNKTMNYRENGAMYICNKKDFLDVLGRTRLPGEVHPYLMSNERSFEIDSELDLEIISKYLEK